MRACNKCLENNWTFRKEEDWIFAVCRSCGYEVSWELKEKSEVKEPGDMCRCGKSKVIYKKCKWKPSKAQKAYWYSGYLFCPKCRKIYYREVDKVINEKVCKKNIEWSLEKARSLIDKTDLSPTMF